MLSGRLERDHRSSGGHRTRVYCLLLVFLLFSHAAPVRAGVVLDGTLGKKGALTGPGYVITSNMGRLKGGNLFHSFFTFNLNKNESALFTGPATVHNIISRITGGTPSNIDGRISSGIQGANFYFINPSGIIFGPNAQLDVTGSFHATTADYVKLGTTGRFDAANPANSVLTMTPPSSFGFLDNTAGGITVNGSFLAVNGGKTLSLVGGDITVRDASLYAPSGRINLVSVASAGEVVPGAAGFGLDAFSSLGRITVRNTSSLRWKIGNQFIGNLDTSGERGGNIFIRGGRFVIDNGEIFSETYGAGRGAGIDIGVRGGMTVQNDSTISSATLGDGDAGSISIDAGTLSLTGVSDIDGSSYGSGNAGVIRINADDVSISDKSGIFSTSTDGEGKGGLVYISASSLTLNSRGKIDTGTYGSRGAGAVTLNVGDLVLSDHSYICSDTSGAGNGGSIIISATGSVSILDHSTIFSSAEEGSAGKAGNILIRTPSLIMDNVGVIAANTFGSGSGGNIMVRVGKLSMTNGAQINSFSRLTGPGGTVSIKATDSITMSGSFDNGDGTITSSGIICETTDGNGGLIFVETPSLIMSDSAAIRSTTFGSGDAGDIRIAGVDVSLTGGSFIAASSLGAGDGGNILINAGGSVSISGSDAVNASGLYSNAFSSGAGGFIYIETPSLSISEGGLMQAATDGYATGDAGFIRLELGKLSLTGGGRIDSSSYGEGLGGNITINATGSVDISGSESGIYSNALWNGDAGFIHIKTPSLTMSDFGTIHAASGDKDNLFAMGDAGLIWLEAERLSMTSSAYIDSSTWGPGDAGGILIDAGNVDLTGGAYIAASSRGEGAGGDIIVKATGAVSISGRDDINSSGLYSNAFWSGQGGFIYMETPSLSISDGGLMQAGTDGYATGDAGFIWLELGRLSLTGGGRIDSSSYGEGLGGAVTINADSLFMDAATISAQTFYMGAGGRLAINADKIYMYNGAEITSSSFGSGNAGDIHIVTDSLKSSGSSISTSADEAAGGNISITAGDVQMRDSSAVTASVASGQGGGGNVSITATTLVALENSDITARADQGYGGNISINADIVLFSGDIDLNASSNVAGREGKVDMGAPVIDISGNLADLPSSFIQADTLLPKPCADREEDMSSFVIKGRDGVPPQPDSLL